MQEIIDYLKENNFYISTMESATGGYIANSITNIGGSSLVFQFGAVTYSNDYKIKMGVSKDIIDKYSVYSMECASSMSEAISKFTNSHFGVGVTGKLNAPDPNNLMGDDGTIYLSIYDSINKSYYNKVIKALNQERVLNKELIKDEFVKLFKEKVIGINQ